MKIESKFEIDQEVFFAVDDDVYDGIIESICVCKTDDKFEIFYIIDGDEVNESDIFTDIEAAVNSVTAKFKQKLVTNFRPKLTKNSNEHYVEFEDEDIDFND